MPTTKELGNTSGIENAVRRLTSFSSLNLAFFFPEDSWVQISTRSCLEVRASLRNPVACIWFMLTDGSELFLAPIFFMTELVWKTWVAMY
jgi:hypothetical protein